MSAKFKSYRPENKTRTFFSRAVMVLIVLFFLRLVSEQFLLQSFIVTSNSMAPDYPKGARVFASPLESKLSGPKEGMLSPSRGSIYFVEPSYYIKPALGLRLIDPVIRFITLEQFSLLNYLNKDWNAGYQMKRVVGLPGDSIYMEEFILFVKPQGEDFYLSEFELSSRVYDLKIDPLPVEWDTSYPFSGNHEEIVLGEGEFYMLADHRTASTDSRFWGPVKAKQLKSKVLVKFWPLSLFSK